MITVLGVRPADGETSLPAAQRGNVSDPALAFSSDWRLVQLKQLALRIEYCLQ